MKFINTVYSELFLGITPPLISTNYCIGRLNSQLENSFAGFILNQLITVILYFTLKLGIIFHNIPIIYKTFSSLLLKGDNVMVICHTLTKVQIWETNRDLF